MLYHEFTELLYNGGFGNTVAGLRAIRMVLEMPELDRVYRPKRAQLDRVEQIANRLLQLVDDVIRGMYVILGQASDMEQMYGDVFAIVNNAGLFSIQRLEDCVDSAERHAKEVKDYLMELLDLIDRYNRFVSSFIM